MSLYSSQGESGEVDIASNNNILKQSKPATPTPAPVQPKVYSTKIDYDFDLADKFLSGMKATVFAPNTFQCSSKTRKVAL
jgi:hypothetical protein